MPLGHRSWKKRQRTESSNSSVGVAKQVKSEEDQFANVGKQELIQQHEQLKNKFMDAG